MTTGYGPEPEHLKLSPKQLQELDEAWGRIVGATWDSQEVDHWLKVSDTAVLEEDK